MRRFILMATMFIVAYQADAEVIAVLRNQAGGFINLTDSATEICKPNGRAVFATSRDGGSSWGCWYLLDEMIHVRWNSGKTSAFPTEDFIVTKKKGTDL